MSAQNASQLPSRTKPEVKKIYNFCNQYNVLPFFESQTTQAKPKNKVKTKSYINKKKTYFDSHK